MDWLIYITAILAVFLAFPLGSWLKRVAKEESIQGREYIALIFYFSIILSIIYLILRQEYAVFTFLFVLVISFQSLRKGKN